MLCEYFINFVQEILQQYAKCCLKMEFVMLYINLSFLYMCKYNLCRWSIHLHHMFQLPQLHLLDTFQRAIIRKISQYRPKYRSLVSSKIFRHKHITTFAAFCVPPGSHRGWVGTKVGNHDLTSSAAWNQKAVPAHRPTTLWFCRAE